MVTGSAEPVVGAVCRRGSRPSPPAPPPPSSPLLTSRRHIDLLRVCSAIGHLA
ncbi:putative leader peptide [Streptomyces sp. NPDC047000]|uniref:putative leader peptide n=1 Tax=Streptomyces sp. NPDC047000 TaxID=3155474 RepID=UPI0033C7A1FC